ncbi:hypothetical protein OAX78_03105, partial [Planctomycetota bacterium]|nr:hypothetical protein [Planctomycetota bacterium]
SNSHAGEWLLSAGGYHPTFRKPSYYPSVSRLAVDWPVSSKLSLSGEAYFALTPSSVMTGGRLDLAYDDNDGLRAWFLADTNTYAQWAPFYFSVDVSVSVGYRYETWAHTFKGDIGARLHLCGPPFSGRLRVDLGPITLKLSFGPDCSPPIPLAWANADGTGFSQTLLPQGFGSRTPSADAALVDGLDPRASTSASFQLSASRGLTDEFEGEGTNEGESIWLARPDAFEWSGHSEIPATEVHLATGVDSDPVVIAPSRTVDDQANDDQANDDQVNDDQVNDDQVNDDQVSDYEVGIRPMSAVLDSSVVTLELRDRATREVLNLPGMFDFERLEQDLSAAKWGPPLKPGQAPAPAEQVLGMLLGISGVRAVAPALTPAGDQQLDVDVPSSLGDDLVESPEQPSPHPLPLDPSATPRGPVSEVAPQSVTLIQETIATPEIVQRRTEIFALLRKFNVDARTNQTPGAFANDPGAFLDGTPRVLSPTS